MIPRRAFLSQLGLVAAAGASAWWLRDHVLWPAPDLVLTPGASGSGWLPFWRPDQGVVIVQARVNGRTVQALVDSGAQTSVIDRALAARLGLPTALAGPLILAFGVSGDPQLGRAATFDLQLGSLSLNGLRAALFDVAALAGASGRPFELILGQDVLHAVVADLDFAAGRLAFHDPAGYSPPPGAAPTPARLKGREVLVPVIVEGARLEVALDTGASSALALSAETAQAAGLLSGRSVGSVPSIGFGGYTRDRLVHVRSFTFAGRTVEDMPVHVYQPSGDHVPDGLLGVAALTGLRLILDTGRASLHLAAT